jgi:hypothetical protein
MGHPAMIESLGDFDRTPALGSIRTSIRSRRFRFPSKDSSYCICIDNCALWVIGPMVAFIFAVK